ncbi:MAG: hypothetical protein ACPG5T_04915, partial [Endozoicomonas sp.]
MNLDSAVGCGIYGKSERFQQYLKGIKTRRAVNGRSLYALWVLDKQRNAAGALRFFTKPQSGFKVTQK